MAIASTASTSSGSDTTGSISSATAAAPARAAVTRTHLRRAAVIPRGYPRTAPVHAHREGRWWQSPVVMAEIRRRVTGQPSLAVEQYFRDRYATTPFGRALSVGAGHGQLEIAMLALGVCR